MAKHSECILEARELTLAWDEDQPVVSNLSMELHEGETVCLVGRSGMGKTTILHALAGLLAPRKGCVLLRGQDVTGCPGKVSYMLQKDLLLPNLRVVDNACLPLTLAGIERARAHERALALLERFGLADAADKWPSQLSGGMRQRVAFARTYLQGNDVMLLDEPFSALDAITRADLRSWYREIAAELGLSTIMITHDADEALCMAERIYVLASPGAGHAARIAGEVVPRRPLHKGSAAAKVDYALTPEFLEAKTAVLALL